MITRYNISTKSDALKTAKDIMKDSIRNSEAYIQVSIASLPNHNLDDDEVIKPFANALALNCVHQSFCGGKEDMMFCAESYIKNLIDKVKDEDIFLKLYKKIL